MLKNFKVLAKYRDYRLIYFSHFISLLGSMASYVVVPYQIYHITNSNFMVGALGVTQLLPVFIFGLIGGSVADRFDRRKIVIVSELMMSLCALGLVVNATLSAPSVPAIFILIFILQSASAYHRPATEAMTQKIVSPEDFHAVASLSSFQYAVSAIVGPALGGWMIFGLGIWGAYVFDLATFVVALIAALMITKNYGIEPTTEPKNFFADMKEGLMFAKGNQVLMGSYTIDIVAMTFAFPVALFPAIAIKYTYEEMIGWLYAGMAMGSLLVVVFIGNWATSKLNRGQMIVWAAALWGVAIFFFGFSFQSVYLAIFLLALAGAADTVSGLQRRVVWNEIIPNNMRGRLAGIEMISYMSGPLLGNFRAGTMASMTTESASTYWGGALCVVIVIICALLLPKFWKYKSTQPAAEN
jgi:MFS family permease